MEEAFDPATLDYLRIAVGLLATTTVGFAIAWLRSRDRAHRAEARLAAAQQPVSLVERRFDRLNQSVEALAGELERLRVTAPR